MARILGFQAAAQGTGQQEDDTVNHKAVTKATVSIKGNMAAANGGS